MKLKQLSLDRTYYNSFHVRHDSYPKYHNSWHYHEELELIWVYRGSGTLFIGDCIESFSAGDVVLIGANLPHYWLFENLTDIDKDDSIDCMVIHFRKDFAGPDFFNLPELMTLKELITTSEKGLLANGTDQKSLGDDFKKLLHVQGVAKLTLLLQILSEFAVINYKKLVSDNYAILNHSNDERRMNDVMNYIRENYKTKIELDKLASQAKMTKNSFCRYFKHKTGKTPIQFVTEIRVAHSCRLLKNTALSLKEICFDSGFNNFVSFHKIFKEQLNLTPTQYRKKLS